MTVDVQRLLAILVAVMALPAVLGGLGRGGAPSAAVVPVHTAQSAAATLNAARFDVAAATGVSPSAVTLLNIQPTTWDGCLGVKSAARACAGLAVSGLIARFEVRGRSYRYHLAGDRYLGPIDPALAEDGDTGSAALTSDTEAALAFYARADLALRESVEPTGVTVAGVIPSLPCKPAAGPIPTNCQAQTAAQATLLLAVQGRDYAYAIVAGGASQRVVPLPSAPGGGSPTQLLQQRVRQDLAARLHASEAGVSILSYVPVRWPDACLGIEQSGQVCAQVVTPGFEATLLATSDGKTEKLYTYRGAGDHFVAADFIPGSQLSPAPLPSP